MIGMSIIFFLLTVSIAAVYAIWTASTKELRAFVLRTLFKGAVCAALAFIFLFVIVNIF